MYIYIYNRQANYRICESVLLSGVHGGRNTQQHPYSITAFIEKRVRAKSNCTRSECIYCIGTTRNE